MMPRRIRDFLNIFGSSTAAAADNAYRDFLEKLRQPAATDIVSNMKM